MKEKDILIAQNSKPEEEIKKIASEDIGRYEEIDTTPFTAIKIKNEWAVVMGNELASSKRFDKLDDLKKYINSKPWELIVTSSLIFKNITKIEKNEK